MDKVELTNAINDIDDGRFARLIESFDIADVCSKCDHFNLAINDERKGYRCKCSPSCLPATLHPDIISYFNWHLGWIDSEQHLVNKRLKHD